MLADEKGHAVTVFDRGLYGENVYKPGDEEKVQAASVDLNKIVRVWQVGFLLTISSAPRMGISYTISGLPSRVASNG